MRTTFHQRFGLMMFVLLLAALISSTSKADFHQSTYLRGYKVQSSSDPSFECSGCARTRLVGCYHGVCSYRCYRSCTNGTDTIIEAHRFVLEGQRKRRRRYVSVDQLAQF